MCAGSGSSRVMIPTPLVPWLAFIALQSIALVSRLAFVSQLAICVGSNSFFQFFNLELNYFFHFFSPPFVSHPFTNNLQVDVIKTIFTDRDCAHVCHWHFYVRA